MYLTKMIRNRYKAYVTLRNENIISNVSMFIDTGAATSHISYHIAKKLNYINYTGVIVDKGGIVKGVRRPFQEAIFDMIIGDITLYQQRLFVAQSEDVTVSLLGVDILSKLNIRQIGESYVFGLNTPHPKDLDIRVTNCNIDEMLHKILFDKIRPEDTKVIKPLLPSYIDMSYEELRKYVEDILRKMSIKNIK